jgi:hypothetical protein
MLAALDERNPVVELRLVGAQRVFDARAAQTGPSNVTSRPLEQSSREEIFAATSTRGRPIVPRATVAPRQVFLNAL